MPCLSYTVGLTLHTIEDVDNQSQFNYSTVDITTLEESPSAPMDVVLEGKDNNTCVEVTSKEVLTDQQCHTFLMLVDKISCRLGNRGQFSELD